MITPEYEKELRKKILKMVLRTTNCIADADVEDLCSAAFMAAVIAYDHFDISKGVALNYYIMRRARGAVLDELRRWDILPRSMRFRVNVLNKTKEKLEKELGREPTDDELANSLEITTDKLLQLQRYSLEGKQMQSIDEDTFEEGSGKTTLSEILMDERLGFDKVFKFDLFEFIRKAVRELKHLYKDVIQKYYWDQLKLREIAKLKGVTESRICQIHKEALRQIGVRLLQAGLNREELSTL